MNINKEEVEIKQSLLITPLKFLEVPESELDEDGLEAETVYDENQVERLYRKAASEENPNYFLEMIEGISRRSIEAEMESIRNSIIYKQFYYRGLYFFRLAQLFAEIVANDLVFELSTIIIIVIDNSMLILNANDPEARSTLPLLFAWYYLIELGVRLLSKSSSFDRNIWKYVDFGIVIVNFFARMGARVSQDPTYSIFFPLIILRLTKIKPFRLIISKIFSSLRQLGESFLILIYFWTLFALMGKLLFAGQMRFRCFRELDGKPLESKSPYCGNYDCPRGHICADLLSNPDQGVTNFDNFFSALLQVFRLSTLDDWSRVMNISQQVYSNYVWIYYVALILVCNILLSNLLLGILKVIYSESFMVGNIFDKDFVFTSKDAKRFDLRLLKQNGLYSSKMTHADNNNFSLTAKSESFSSRLSSSPRNHKAKIAFSAKNSIKKMTMKTSKNIQKLVLNILKKDTNLCKRMLPQHYGLQPLNEREYVSLSEADLLLSRSEERKLKKLTLNSKWGRNGKPKLMMTYNIEQIIEMSFGNDEKEKASNAGVKATNFNKNRPNNAKESEFERTAKSKKTHQMSDSILKRIQRNNGRILRLSFDHEKRKQTRNKEKVPLKENKSTIKHLKLDISSQGRRAEGTSAKENGLNKKKTLEFDLSRKEIPIGSRKSLPDIDVTSNFALFQMKALINENLMKEEDEREASKEEEDEDYLDYQQILVADNEKKVIEKENWSANSILNHEVLTTRKLKSIVYSLNKQEFDIWMPGLSGRLRYFRGFAKSVANSSAFVSFFLICDALHSIFLNLEGLVDYKWLYDNIINFQILFIVEFSIKILGLGLKNYLRSVFNLIDFFSVIYILVLLGFIERIKISDTLSSNIVFRYARIILVFRILKISKYLHFMQMIFEIIRFTFNEFASIIAFFFLFLIFYSLMGRQLNEVAYEKGSEEFSTFGNSFISVFQVITLDDWFFFLISDYNTGYFKRYIQPIFLLNVVIVGNMIFYNLFATVLLNGFDEVNQILMESELALEDQTLLKETPNNKAERKSTKVSKKSFLTQSSIKAPKKRKAFLVDQIKLKQVQKKITTNLLSVLESLWDPFTKFKIKHKNMSHIKCKNSLFLFEKHHILREICFRIEGSRFFYFFISASLIFEVILMGIHTFHPSNYHLAWARIINTLFFAFEASVRIIVHGFVVAEGSYMREVFNVINMAKLLGSLMEALMSAEFEQFSLFLQCFQCLRVISHFHSTKEILLCVVDSCKGLLNVIFPLFLIWSTFAVLGLTLFRDRFGYCEAPTNFLISKQECLRLERTWVVNPLNFDTIYDGLLTLLVISSLDNWRDLLSVAVNANTNDNGPTRGNMKYTAYVYFITFIIIGIWFFLKLVLGVVFFNFLKSQKRRNLPFLNDNEIKWLEIQRKILSAKPFYHAPRRSNFLRFKIYMMINTPLFQKITVAVLLSNLILMILSGDLISESLNSSLFVISLMINAFYMLEMLLKIVCFGVKGYANYPAFRFEALIVLIFTVEIGLFQKGFSDPASTKHENDFYKLIIMARMFKILPIVRLIRKLSFLEQTMKTIESIAPKALQLILVLLMIIFFFSVLGGLLFHQVKRGKIIDEYSNFKNVFYGMMILLRCITTDRWSDIMMDLGSSDRKCRVADECGSEYSKLFFVLFMILTNYIFLNVLNSVLLYQFEDSYRNPSNPLQLFKDNILHFQKKWAEYSSEKEKNNISVYSVFDFLMFLGPPLGMQADFSFQDMLRKTVSLEIRSKEELVGFNELLHAVLKNYYQENGFFSEENEKATEELKKHEEHFFKIQSSRNNMGLTTRNLSVIHPKKPARDYTSFNGFYMYLTLSIVHRTWRKYSETEERRNNFGKSKFRNNYMFES